MADIWRGVGQDLMGLGTPEGSVFNALLPVAQTLDSLTFGAMIATKHAPFRFQAMADDPHLAVLAYRCQPRDRAFKAVKRQRLSVLDILDSFGQRSLIQFSAMQANASLPANTFQFKPPAGADVVKQ